MDWFAFRLLIYVAGCLVALVLMKNTPGTSVAAGVILFSVLFAFLLEWLVPTIIDLRR